MTDDEIEAAKTVQKTSIKAYVNSTDSTRALQAIQILISAMINNAGSLENLTAINATLYSILGPSS